MEPGPHVQPRWTFALRAPAASGPRFWQAVPPPGAHDLIAHAEGWRPAAGGRSASLHGQSALFQESYWPCRAPPAPEDDNNHGCPAIRSRHRPLLAPEVDGNAIASTIEEAGSGIALLCLHTAGSDGRQFRGLMNDEALTAQFRVIAFDLPWHGKSSPPARLAGGRIPSHLARLCPHRDGGHRRPGARAAGLHGLAPSGAEIVLPSGASRQPQRFRALIGT